MRSLVVIILLLTASCGSSRKLTAESHRKVDSTAVSAAESTSDRVVSLGISGSKTVNLIRFGTLTPELIASGITSPPVEEVLQVVERVTAAASDSSKLKHKSKADVTLKSDMETKVTEKEPLRWWQAALIWIGVATLAAVAIKLLISKLSKKIKL